MEGWQNGRPEQALESTTNQFGGVIITPEALPENPDEFRARLRHSLAVWTQQEFRLVWLEVPIDHSSLIPVAVEAGFVFHHSDERRLMLVCRLQAAAFVPPYASHYIGAGGVVLNERQALLVVSERHRRSQSKPYYKLPGGALHQGEHLVDGVIREIFEETGVRARFEALICFRHWHGYRFGKSDIYFICRLAPLSQEISMQVDEIEECFWMPVSEYLDSPYVGTFNKQIVQAALQSPGVVPTRIEGHPNPSALEFFMPNGAG